MEKRLFPNIGREISLLGFGLMRLPLTDDNPKNIDYPLAEKMVDRALAGGINYFDTAYVYHEGQSEVFAGKTLSRHPRDSYNLATKMPTWMLQSLDQAKEIFHEQLQKLRTDRLDFYLVHNLTTDSFKIHEKIGLYKFLRQMKDEGVIKFLGFSMHDSPEHLALLLSRYEWDFVQIQLNYIDWTDLKSGELYRQLAEKRIPSIIMEPVRGGALARLPHDAADTLKNFNDSVSQASWAVRYAASLPGVMTVLSGMTLPEHLEDNLKAFEKFKPLNDEERKVLDAAAEKFRLANPIPCTGCGYCMECAQGVNIPVNLSVFNQYHAILRETPGVASIVFDNIYRALQDKEKADKCVACEDCLPLCPQKIAIPEQLKKIVELCQSIS
ncbi:MAG: aldo/keto reductase [Deltaproteobacteria bacterium]|jgi:predicted aldo/keto reductase-like oxidoreductase|nr:aldo/keto reductase [Deltaproteobacteria bacterium]